MIKDYEAHHHLLYFLGESVALWVHSPLMMATVLTGRSEMSVWLRSQQRLYLATRHWYRPGGLEVRLSEGSKT